MIESDSQTAPAGMLLSGRELQVELPLDILMKQNATPVLSRKLARGARFRVLILLRPRRPIPNVRMFFVNRFIQRRVNREAVEQVALALDIIAKLACAAGVCFPLVQKLAEHQLQKSHLETVHSFVLDELLGA